MSKEPAEIFGRAADDGFIQQVRYYQYIFACEAVTHIAPAKATFGRFSIRTT